MGSFNPLDPISTVTDGLFGGGGGSDAADSAEYAAEIQAEYQKEALDYLKEREELPQQYREQALGELAAVSGLEGDGQAQAAMIERAKASPLYRAIMGGQEAGEEAILRNAGATGMLRSGNVQDALAKNATELENQALLTAYNQQLQGIQGLAGLPSLAPQIAQVTTGIGQTLAQGQIAGAQIEQQAQQNQMGNLMGMAQLGLGAAAAFSDVRLKKDIKVMGDINGHAWYEWTWNKAAKLLGLEGRGEGVMAHEVYEKNPELISHAYGYLTVDYGGVL